MALATIIWTEKVRYPSVYLVSPKALNCNYGLTSLSSVHSIRSVEM